MDRYKPIACSLLEIIEAAATRRSRVTLTLTDGKSRTAIITDVFSKDKQEYVKGIQQGSGKPFTLRLDKIREITDLLSSNTYISSRL